MSNMCCEKRRMLSVYEKKMKSKNKNKKIRSIATEKRALKLSASKEKPLTNEGKAKQSNAEIKNMRKKIKYKV